MKVIIVAGIHGVGKSSSCKLASERLGIPFYTASQIIKNERLSVISEKSKHVSDINENQRILIQGIAKLKNNTSFLLDGHFTLLSTDGNIEPIPLDVFKNANINGIILFIDNPDNIYERLLIRDNLAISSEELKHYQNEEIKYAKYVAKSLSVPMITLNSFDIEGMVNAINKWI